MVSEPFDHDMSRTGQIKEIIIVLKYILLTKAPVHPNWSSYIQIFILPLLPF